jgi:hypothetical protein
MKSLKQLIEKNKKHLSLKQLVEDAQDYHDSDSGSGMVMDPNKSELNDSAQASIEYTFTAPDNSKIEVEIDPEDYHIMGIKSDRGKATQARFELKINIGGNISKFRKQVDTLIKLGFKVNKKASTHTEFDPI